MKVYIFLIKYVLKYNLLGQNDKTDNIFFSILQNSKKN